jgi:hypothetical protein
MSMVTLPVWGTAARLPESVALDATVNDDEQALRYAER